MEPTSTAKQGKQGALNNPEIVENVPGHVIPILEHEFDDFDNEAEQFLSGQTEEDVFIKFRLKQGVYGQRQADVQMCRIKLPMGGITPEQWEMFADVTEEYAPLNKSHITTRQNIQLHHIPLRQMAELIRKISASGLSSREGCGNTVRNVTGDPYAGVCTDELFDITPWAGAYVRYFVRHPTTQAMPRKIKTAFTASDADRAITGIHDIAYIPRIKNGVKGVEVRVGGGTSIMPRIAPTLYEFVELENGDYLKIAEACFRIFDRQDFLRVNRARARIKVLIDKIGIDEFRDMVEEELKGEWVAERNFDPTDLLLIHDEEANAPAADATFASPNGDLSEFEAFRATNVKPQRQEGFSTIDVRVYRGDLSPEQMRAIAEIQRRYSGGYARTTIEQNFVLRWVRDESVYEVWQELSKIGLGEGGSGRLIDTVSCPGTDSCKLGITSSMGLNAAMNDRIKKLDIKDELTQKIHVKNSGCPNGCGQHHIANIGFYGASIKVGDKTIPAYIPHIGGNYENGEVIYGTRLKSRLPAKRVPDALERWLAYYQENREEGEEFNAFALRVGPESFTELVKDLSMPVDFSLENMDYFVDWSRDQLYEVVRGEGECAV